MIDHRLTQPDDLAILLDFVASVLVAMTLDERVKQPSAKTMPVGTRRLLREARRVVVLVHFLGLILIYLPNTNAHSKIDSPFRW